MTKRKGMIFGTVLTVFVVLLWAVAARHETPFGQPRLADVTQQTLSQVREEFNASPDSERVVLLLSPTCPVCVEGSSVMNPTQAKYRPEAKADLAIPTGAIEKQLGVPNGVRRSSIELRRKARHRGRCSA
jgi:hypothetical protein